MTESFNLFKFRWWQLGALLSIVLVVWWLTTWNLAIASAKARDWERKEQLKRIGNTLVSGYLVDNKGLPPMTQDWQMMGCEAEMCLTGDMPGPVCNWRSDAPTRAKWRCEGLIYIDPMSISPDNRDTPGPDTYKYKRVTAETAFLETCLERSDDPEMRSVSESQMGWTEEECPSGVIYQWPGR